MTPPFNIVVVQPRHDEALTFAAGALHSAGASLPGASGAFPEVDVFVGAWEAAAGVRRRLRMAQGVYGARAVRMTEGVPGRAREAVAADRALLLEWFHAFEGEALHDETPHGELERGIARRLASPSGGIVLWEVDGRAVSLCGYGGPTPHGIRIGPVYTPPALRRRGYASAVTACVTKQQLDGGREFCFLYTDLANSTSNRLYMNIGYERVCDAADYEFDVAATSRRP